LWADEYLIPHLHKAGDVIGRLDEISYRSFLFRSFLVNLFVTGFYFLKINLLVSGFEKPFSFAVPVAGHLTRLAVEIYSIM